MSFDILLICLCLFGKISFYLSWSVLTLSLTQILSASTAFYTLSILTHLFCLVLYIGWLDIEFFFLLYLLIYVSALAILFLFTLFFLPIDSSMLLFKTDSTQKVSDSFDNVTKKYFLNYIEWVFLSCFFFLFNFLDSLRLDYLKHNIKLKGVIIFDSFHIDNPLIFFSGNTMSLSTEVPSWVDCLVYEQLLMDTKLTQATLDIQSLGWILYERFPAIILIVLLALLVVLFGTLDWLRKAEKYNI